RRGRTSMIASPLRGPLRIATETRLPAGRESVWLATPIWVGDSWGRSGSRRGGGARSAGGAPPPPPPPPPARPADGPGPGAPPLPHHHDAAAMRAGHGRAPRVGGGEVEALATGRTFHARQGRSGTSR